MGDNEDLLVRVCLKIKYSVSVIELAEEKGNKLKAQEYLKERRKQKTKNKQMKKPTIRMGAGN